MFVPMWLVWVVGLLVAAPVLLFCVGCFLLLVELGKDAERNTALRAGQKTAGNSQQGLIG